jgi:hypothetical protein
LPASLFCWNPVAFRARLVVQQHEFGALRDFFEIPERVALARNRAAVHADPKAVRAARRLYRAVVQVPDFQAPPVVPLDPFPVHRIVPIAGGRKRAALLVPKLARAVLAMANAVAPQAAPTVIGESFRVRTLDDLRKHARDVFVVIRAVHTGDVLVFGAIRLALRIPREPVGMHFEEVRRRAVGIHARQHGQAIRVRRGRDLAVKIAPVQELCAMCSGNLLGS